MAGRIATILTRFSGCYSVTRSIRQSFRFAFMTGNKGKTLVKLDHKQIWLRKNKTDQEVFLATFLYQFHRSPVDLGPAPVIIDLGSNIGLTMIDIKQQYPKAKIIGVELDKDNYELCLQNIAELDNCSVLHAAIWKEDGFVNYKGKDEQSYTILSESFSNDGPVKCLTMNSFLKEKAVGNIDYLKMDIEGAEYAILLESHEKTWLQKVKYLSVEVHGLPAIDNITGGKKLKAELEKNNFIVFQSALHWSSLFAVNKSMLST